MAYAARVTWRMSRVSGIRRLEISVHETEAAAASEWTAKNDVIAGVTVLNADTGLAQNVPLFRSGRMRALRAQRISGTGTQISPRAGRAAAWADSTMPAIYVTSPAAAFHDYSSDLTVAFAEAGAEAALFGASVPSNAAADHVIRTELVIDEVA